MNSKILFFSSPWWGPCSSIKKILTEDLLKELSIEIIDIAKDENLSLVTKHKVMNVPTFIKIEGDKETSRKIGSMSINDLRNL